MTLSSPNAKIRLYEVINHKIQKEYKGIEPINEIQEFMTLYAEVTLLNILPFYLILIFY